MSAPLPYLGADDLRAAAPPALERVDLAAAALATAGAPAGGPRVEIAWTPTGPAATGLPAGAGLTALLDGAGAPLLVVDRAAFLALRGGAMAAVAARALGDPASEVMTILGCNATGRAAMECLLAVFPDTERMLCWDPHVETQNAFADEIMTSFDVASIIPPEPREATEGAHVLVSCLPVTGSPRPVVEAEWLQTATLLAVLDLDATIAPTARARADRRLTDSLAGWRACVSAGHLAGLPEPGEELGPVLAGKAPGRGPGVPIISTTIVGHPAVDLALAEALARGARAAGRGRAP